MRVIRLNRFYRSARDLAFPTGSHLCLAKTSSYRVWQPTLRCLHVVQRSLTHRKRRKRKRFTMAKPLIAWAARKCLAHRTVWKSTWDALTSDGARLLATSVGKRLVMQWVWNNTKKSTPTRELLSASSATRPSKDPRLCPLTCLFTQTRDRFPVTTAERDFIRNRTWKNTLMFTRARSRTNVSSVEKRLVNLAISSLTVENIQVSNLSLAKCAIEHFTEKLILGGTHIRMRWNNFQIKSLRWINETSFLFFFLLSWIVDIEIF